MTAPDACCSKGHVYDEANTYILEIVTHRENTLRGEAPSAKAARKTHCKRGHPFDEANTYRHPNDGSRHCRICTRTLARERYRARRLLAEAQR